MLRGLQPVHLDALHSLVRTAVAAPPGRTLVARRAISGLADDVLDRLYDARLIGFSGPVGSSSCVWLSNLVRCYVARHVVVVDPATPLAARRTPSGRQRIAHEVKASIPRIREYPIPEGVEADEVPSEFPAIRTRIPPCPSTHGRKLVA
jgi:hypothetical protein